MDTQLNLAEDDEEWAVDRVLSHHGSRTEAVFEILWKSGDTTWLPYYQITHLQALTDYLELLGVRKIAKLANGLGRPPLDDPQVFIGSITVPTPSYPTCSFFSAFHRSFPFNLNTVLQSFSSRVSLFFTTSVITPTIDLELLAFMPALRGVDHPRFVRISTTHYLIRDVTGITNSTVHVGQVADFLNFEKNLRELGGIDQLKSMPMGYLDFADLWNAGVYEGDPRRLSNYTFVDNAQDPGPILSISTSPVDIDDFFITQHQVGLRVPERPSQPAESPAPSYHPPFRRVEPPPHFEPSTRFEPPIRSAPNNRFSSGTVYRQPENYRDNPSPYDSEGRQERYRDPKTPYDKRQERRRWRPKSGSQAPADNSSVLSRLNFRARRVHRQTDSEPNTSNTSSSSSTTTEDLSQPAILPTNTPQDATMLDVPVPKA
jgi:hypothetical protein